MRHGDGRGDCAPCPCIVYCWVQTAQGDSNARSHLIPRNKCLQHRWAVRLSRFGYRQQRGHQMASGVSACETMAILQLENGRSTAIHQRGT